jgi:hypothetical protein
MGEPELCDFPPIVGIPVRLRNHVTFRSIDGRPADLEEAVADFRSYWMELDHQQLAALEKHLAGKVDEERSISVPWRRKIHGPRRRLLWRQMWFELHGLKMVTVAFTSRKTIMTAPAL